MPRINASYGILTRIISQRMKQPLSVRRVDFRHGDADHFRNLIGVMFQEARLQSRKKRGAGLDLRDGFRGGFNLSLPTVDRMSGRETHTSCELLFEKKCANLSRVVLVRKTA